MAFLDISPSCFCIVSLLHWIHLSSIHFGASSILTIPSSANLDSRSDEFSSLDGVISPLAIIDFGSLSVTIFFAFDSACHATGSHPPTIAHVVRLHKLVSHVFAISIQADCNAHSVAQSPTFVHIPADCPASDVGDGASASIAVPHAIFPARYEFSRFVSFANCCHSVFSSCAVFFRLPPAFLRKSEPNHLFP